MTLHLTVSLAGSGFHPAAWRASRLQPGPNAAPLRDMARTAERGLLDAVFFGLEPVGPMRLDPLPLLGSVIAATRHIGLGAAWTIDFTEPYNVARVFASLDYLSHGRTAWLVDLFGTAALLPYIGKPRQTADIAEYCRRAGEFIDVVRKLWDSWQDAAFAIDKASGMFVNPELVQPIDHAGPYFTVRGPLNVPRPPQGNPLVVMHDPMPEAARKFAATTADVIIVAAGSMSEARQRYAQLQESATGELRVLVCLAVVLGETEEIARGRATELDGMAAPSGDLRFIGTPERLAEIAAGWQAEGACDGFHLLPSVLPDDLDLLVDRVMPLLRERGLTRAACTGGTLREHFGVKRPRSQYEKAS